jgi:hydrogenase-4 component B
LSQIVLFCLSITVPFALGFLIVFLPLNDRRQLARLSLLLALLGGLVAVGWAAVFWNQPLSSGEIVLSGRLQIDGLPELELELYIDRLAALFILLVGGFSLVVSVYSFVYLGLVNSKGDKLENDAHGIAAAYNLFVYTMLLVLAANNVFTLLVCLEAMSLSFGYLVLFRHNKYRDEKGIGWEESDRRVRKQAIQSYLISSHVSLVLFSVGLLLRADQVGSFSFDAFRNLGTEAGALTFWLVFIGLAVRAGVTPFHIWVPLAHPSSPTNTHALSLGIAIKVAVFLMIRVFFELLGPIPAWWGPVVMVFASLTAVVGVYYAIVSRDLKTALSCHSVENVGIILVGIGLALTLAADNLRTVPGIIGLAGLALIAGLYHTINHAIFKGLLYLCTGAIEKLTGTVEYHELGGLMKRFPWTSVGFLVGAVSIAGFPPFNGFVSEWLTLQTLFSSLGAFSTSVRLFPAFVTLISTLLLATAFGLTAFAFVKIAGEAILGAPRTKESGHNEDVPWFTRLVFICLGLLCLLLGIFPSPVVTALTQVTASLGIPSAAVQGQISGILLGSATVSQDTVYLARLSSILFLVLTLGLLLLIAWVMIRGPKKQETSKSVPVWTSSIRYNGKQMQATEAYFGYQVYVPFSRSKLAKADQQGTPISGPLDDGLPMSERREAIEYFRVAYNAVLSRLLHFAEWFILAFQNGGLRRYVLYGFIMLVALLAILLALGGR